MERKFNFSINEFYHVYNRGNNKSIIFKNNADYQRFIKLLYVCNSIKPVVFKTIQGLPLDKIERGETLVDIGAYCLMPNHFHLFLHEKIENGISLFMGKLLTAYSMYFNKRNERAGKLFEGPFKAAHVNNDKYLKYLFSYIHLNPIKLIDSRWKENKIINKNRAQIFLRRYVFSSYLDYLGIKRKENSILNKTAFPKYFNTKKDFEDFIDDWLSFNEISKDSPWKEEFSTEIF